MEKLEEVKKSLRSGVEKKKREPKSTHVQTKPKPNQKLLQNGNLLNQLVIISSILRQQLTDAN
ncbi:hypothetical protein CYCD_30340 [Tenuifilaceae bacterium CYCD]|nr:hypothetical protein CYCD_30340 [Tenuifilaceae bacterium CYCD]